LIYSGLPIADRQEQGAPAPSTVTEIKADADGGLSHNPPANPPQARAKGAKHAKEEFVSALALLASFARNCLIG